MISFNCIWSAIRRHLFEFEPTSFKAVKHRAISSLGCTQVSPHDATVVIILKAPARLIFLILIAAYTSSMNMKVSNRITFLHGYNPQRFRPYSLYTLAKSRQTKQLPCREKFNYTFPIRNTKFAKIAFDFIVFPLLHFVHSVIMCLAKKFSPNKSSTYGTRATTSMRAF